MAKSQEHGSIILLRLKGYEVEKVIEEEGIIAEVRAIVSTRLNCPRCDATRIHRHSSAMKRRVLHSWSSGKKVYLELCHQRWRCRECNHSFNDGAQLLRPYSRITRQAEAEVLWQHLRSGVLVRSGEGWGSAMALYAASWRGK